MVNGLCVTVIFGRLRRDFRLSHFCAPAVSRKTPTLHLTSSPRELSSSTNPYIQHGIWASYAYFFNFSRYLQNAIDDILLEDTLIYVILGTPGDYRRKYSD